MKIATKILHGQIMKNVILETHIPINNSHIETFEYSFKIYIYKLKVFEIKYLNQ